MLAQEKKATITGGANPQLRPNSDEAEPMRTDETLAQIAGVGKTKLREYEHVKETATPESGY